MYVFIHLYIRQLWTCTRLESWIWNPNLKMGHCVSWFHPPTWSSLIDTSHRLHHLSMAGICKQKLSWISSKVPLDQTFWLRSHRCFSIDVHVRAAELLMCNKLVHTDSMFANSSQETGSLGWVGPFYVVAYSLLCPLKCPLWIIILFPFCSLGIIQYNHNCLFWFCAWVCVWACPYLWVSVCVCVCACVCLWVFACVDMCIFICAYVYMRACICACIHVRVCAHVFVYSYVRLLHFLGSWQWDLITIATPCLPSRLWLHVITQTHTPSLIKHSMNLCGFVSLCVHGLAQMALCLSLHPHAYTSHDNDQIPEAWITYLL